MLISEPRPQASNCRLRQTSQQKMLKCNQKVLFWEAPSVCHTPLDLHPSTLAAWLVKSPILLTKERLVIFLFDLLIYLVIMHSYLHHWLRSESLQYPHCFGDTQHKTFITGLCRDLSIISNRTLHLPWGESNRKSDKMKKISLVRF